MRAPSARAISRKALRSLLVSEGFGGGSGAGGGAKAGAPEASPSPRRIEVASVVAGGRRGSAVSGGAGSAAAGGSTAGGGAMTGDCAGIGKGRRSLTCATAKPRSAPAGPAGKPDMTTRTPSSLSATRQSVSIPLQVRFWPMAAASEPSTSAMRAPISSRIGRRSIASTPSSPTTSLHSGEISRISPSGVVSQIRRTRSRRRAADGKGVTRAGRPARPRQARAGPAPAARAPRPAAARARRAAARLRRPRA